LNEWRSNTVGFERPLRDIYILYKYENVCTNDEKCLVVGPISLWIKVALRHGELSIFSKVEMCVREYKIPG
jgi:hypothetical protein